jgi:hypothetical protein
VLITWRLHPHIPDVLRVLLVALPVSGAILGLAGRRRVPRDERRGANIVARVALVLVLFIFGIGLFLSSLCGGSREGAQVTRCKNNLSNIWLVIDSYTKSHGGNYPPTLEALVSDPSVGMSPELLLCPASNDSLPMGSSRADMIDKLQNEPGHVSYVYVLPTVSPGTPPAADEVLLYEHPENHHRHGHLHVLFRNGEIRYLTRSEANALIPDLANAPAPPRTEKSEGSETW